MGIAVTGTLRCREGRAWDLGPGDGCLGNGHAERLRQQQQLHVEAPALQPLAGVQPPRRAAREQLRARGRGAAQPGAPRLVRRRPARSGGGGATSSSLAHARQGAAAAAAGWGTSAPPRRAMHGGNDRFMQCPPYMLRCCSTMRMRSRSPDHPRPHSVWAAAPNPCNAARPRPRPACLPRRSAGAAMLTTRAPAPPELANGCRAGRGGAARLEAALRVLDRAAGNEHDQQMEAAHERVAVPAALGRGGRLQVRARAHRQAHAWPRGSRVRACIGAARWPARRPGACALPRGIAKEGRMSSARTPRALPLRSRQR